MRLAPSPTPLPCDVTRLEQLLDLQQDVLAPPDEPGRLPARLVQAAVSLLGTPGAALGVVRDGRYHVLAVAGHGEVFARHDGTAADDGVLAPALAGARPLRLPAGPAGAPALVLPVRAPGVVGALHVLLPSEGPSDDAIHLCRFLAVLAGVALGNAERWRRLHEAARAKADLLAAMAHDLRAPLNAVIGYAGMLDEGAFGPLTAEQREITATLGRQARDLADLLGAALDVAGMETGRLPVRVEDFAIADVLQTLGAGTFARASREGAITWTIGAGVPLLRSDRVKVKEIVQNLVDNALKHGRPPVAVEVVAVPERALIRLAVRDHGAGIPPTVLPHLFEAFRSGSREGTGLGLYIVRCFAERLGGRVAARTALGEGSAITVELPVVAPGA
ncbi:MAG TPA: HAMP domain-containing sensor histidine kinase [Candidatus Binatia bacterium]|nr:HAMP domain-containing sensor histidine kinase [Candidatus Binatia bacterium]